MLIARVKIKWSSPTPKCEPPKDLQALLNKDICAHFAQNVKEKLAEDASYTSLCRAVEDAMHILPNKMSPHVKKSWDSELSQRIAQMNVKLQSAEAVVLTLIDASASNAEEEVVRSYARLLKSNPRLAWAHIGALNAKPARRVGGDTPDDRTRLFHLHFSKLFDGNKGERVSNFFSPKHAPLFNSCDFSPGEVAIVLDSLPSGKACGSDIPNEVLRLQELRPYILRLLNLMLHANFEKAQKESMLVPLPKKGDLSLPSNWRGISLMQHLTKVFDKLVMMRLRSAIDPLLSPLQNGFRPCRSTTQHAMAMSQLIDIALSRRTFHIHGIYVDFSKAFDSVSWWAVEDCLVSWGVPQLLIDAVMNVMNGHVVRVRNEGQLSEAIDVKCGVLQGDTLAPFLFVRIVAVIPPDDWCCVHILVVL